MQKIQGSDLAALFSAGIKNLEKNKKLLNDLNVFPVPDGDTGTNMVMTLKCGYEAIKDKELPLCELASSFASAAVFGARGNSGVIVSQFFRGLASELSKKDSADARALADALERGSEFAYSSVAAPVEGTMLTVIKDASCALGEALPIDSVDAAIDIFLLEARASLERTPELLPILKKAGVVDSGACGIVCFFEGIQLFLRGEDISVESESEGVDLLDLSRFDKNTSFAFGYCIEGLIQLGCDMSEFDHCAFKKDLSTLGDSIVTSLEGDKVKLHVHSKAPEDILGFCRKYGEFLTVKIENMSVQNIVKGRFAQKAQKMLCRDDGTASGFAVITVAANVAMQNKFFEMGADVSIVSEIAPSSGDFLEAFRLTGAKEILVFPNSSNSILAAKQAASLYRDAKVAVANSRSLAQCYASLSVLDFDGSLSDAVDTVNSTVSNMYGFFIYRSERDVKFGSRDIAKNVFFALADNNILEVEDTLDDLVQKTVQNILSKHEYEVSTLFCGNAVSLEYGEHLAKLISDLGFDIEVAIVETFESSFHLAITLE